MGFFDNMKDRAKRLAEIAKLKTANLGEEDTIKKAYIELGKLYYAEKGASPDGAYVAACERIDAARAAIETNNDRIAELKTAGDAVIVDDGPIVDGSPPRRPPRPTLPRRRPPPRSSRRRPPRPRNKRSFRSKNGKLAFSAQPETVTSPGWAVFCCPGWKERKAGPGIAAQYGGP